MIGLLERVLRFLRDVPKHLHQKNVNLQKTFNELTDSYNTYIVICGKFETTTVVFFNKIYKQHCKGWCIPTADKISDLKRKNVILFFHDDNDD